MSSEPFIVREYLRFKQVWLGTYEQRKSRRRGARGESVPFGAGRDPRPLADTLASVTEDMGWKTSLAETTVALHWAELVGETLSEHVRVVSISDGVLTAQCDSTAWATEMRRLRVHVLSRINADYPEAGITEIKFIAPNAPSWKHGPKSIPGRGPRDTYG